MVNGYAFVQYAADQLHALCKDKHQAQFEAVQILHQVMGNTSFLHTMTQKQEQQTHSFLKQRLTGRPLQYVLGEWEFYGLLMYVGEGVLIPRPETELLAELGIRHLKNKQDGIFADLCTGSGCVGIAVCKNTSATGIGADISHDALVYARKNIQYHNLIKRFTLHNADITDQTFLSKQPLFDCVLANPPYITKQDMTMLQREVTFEPVLALDGGIDGLDCYRRLIPLWRERLKKDGLLAVEIGIGQAQAVCQIFKSTGLSPEIKSDYNDIERIVYGYNRE